jgi:hypothetical protein
MFTGVQTQLSNLTLLDIGGDSKGIETLREKERERERESKRRRAKEATSVRTTKR